MKNNYNLEYFLNKVKSIYNNHIKNIDLDNVIKKEINNKEIDNKEIDNKEIDNKETNIKDNFINDNKIAQYVLINNSNKISPFAKKSIHDYDKKLRDNITVLTNTDKELIKIKIHEYSTSAKDDNNRNNPKVREYIDTVIKPKALELTKEYFKNNDSENPLISWKDNVKTIIDFDKKLKNAINQKNFIKKMTDSERKEHERIRKQKYRKKKALELGYNFVSKMGTTEEEKREYKRLYKQKERAAKKKLDSESDNNNKIKIKNKSKIEFLDTKTESESESESESEN
jgi:hypothetical protein